MKKILPYEQIIHELIASSFPSLHHKRIWIRETKYLKTSADASWYFFSYGILVHPRLCLCTKKQLIGAFAHELCHIEDFVKRSFFQNIISFVRYLYSFYMQTSYAYSVERATDILTIKKGYGEELKAYRKWLDKHPYPYLKKIGKNYLTAKEIDLYMENVGSG